MGDFELSLTLLNLLNMSVRAVSSITNLIKFDFTRTGFHTSREINFNLIRDI